MTRNRNFTDQAGYGQVPWDEANPWLAALIGGVLVISGAFIGGMLS